MSVIDILIAIISTPIVWIIVIYIIHVYNKLVKSRNIKTEAWSGVDVQLKKRHDLVPNLINIVKTYAAYESELIEKVTLARSSAMEAKMINEKSSGEGLLGAQLGNLMVLVEDYPDLKANDNFLDLQENLADIEDTIQHARRYYNGSVRDLNNLIEKIPSNIVARLFRFKKAEFFEIQDAQERKVPKSY